MTTSSASPSPWEIWLAYVRFADHPEVGKVRPVVILDDLTVAIIAAKVTTATPQERFTYCELSDWQTEGLLRPSRVQCKPLVALRPSDLLRGEPLGMLSQRDRMALAVALR